MSETGGRRTNRLNAADGCSREGVNSCRGGTVGLDIGSGDVLYLAEGVCRAFEELVTCVRSPCVLILLRGGE